MIIKKKFAGIASVMMVLSIIMTFQPMWAKASFTPLSILRIGLNFDSTVLPSANLQNVEGAGSGFDFGYFDDNKVFVPIGAWTDETRITMTMDRNMVWHPGDGGGAGQYREGTTGAVVIGAFHIQLNAQFDAFGDALAAAGNYQGAFVRYENGAFIVLIGQYTSRAAAESAMTALDIPGASINAGTASTITIVRTGTNVILFEYEHGTSRHLGVMPRHSGEGKAETWFLGFRYNGGFQYARRGGALLTVANMIEVEDYIKGVIPYEMANNWPIEALKAQALCARTFAMYYAVRAPRHASYGVDMCTTTCCQVYRGRNLANERTDQAVEETAGRYITHEGLPVQTFYYSSNGGASESVENVWFDPLPHLRGVRDPFEADIASGISGYHWERSFTPADLAQRLRNRGHSVSNIASMRVSEYTPTGNVLSVTFTDNSGRSVTLSRLTQINNVLGVRSLRFDVGNSRWQAGGIHANSPAQAISSNTGFSTIDGNGVVAPVTGGTIHAITGSGNIGIVTGGGSASSSGGSGTGLINGVFTIRGTGWGHSVGMSQWGAYSQALHHGRSYEDIIHFYFTGVEIIRA